MVASCRARTAVFLCAAFLPKSKKKPDIDLEAGGDYLASAGSSNDYYAVLKVGKKASTEEIKKAYRKQSLLMHPDKLAQRGHVSTDDDKKTFLRIKESYDVLVDSEKRSLYDAVGDKAYMWASNPMSIDKDEIWENFCRSSVFDRSKIFFALLVGFGIFVTPAVLFCIRTDGGLSSAPYTLVLLPAWLVSLLLLAIRIKVVTLPQPTKGPDEDENAPDPEPLYPPRVVRLASFLSLFLLVLFAFLASLKIDDSLGAPWEVVFIPLFMYELLGLSNAIIVSRTKVITVEEVEVMLSKSFTQFTAEDRADIMKNYDVFLPVDSPEYKEVIGVLKNARGEIMWTVTRILVDFFACLVVGGAVSWSWWLAFTPFWIVSCVICSGGCLGILSTNGEMADMEQDEKDEAVKSAAYGATDDSVGLSTDTDAKVKLSPEERAVRRAELALSGQNALTSCCGSFTLAFFICLVVGRLDGGDYSSLWIIFPFLLIVGVILCCFALCIFGANEDTFEKQQQQQKQQQEQQQEKEDKNEGGSSMAGYTSVKADLGVPKPLVFVETEEEKAVEEGQRVKDEINLAKALEREKEVKIEEERERVEAEVERERIEKLPKKVNLAEVELNMGDELD